MCSRNISERRQTKQREKKKTDFRNFPRTEGMSFQSGSHVLPMHRVKTDPAERILWNFKAKAAPVHRLNNPHHAPLHREVQGDTVQQSKKGRKKKRKTHEFQVTQLRTDAQGISGMRRKDDLWRRAGASGLSGSLIWIRCVQPRRPWQRSLQSEKIPEACDMLVENLDSVCRVQDRMRNEINEETKWNN